MSADELSHLHLLEHAQVDIEGRMPWSSNATFLCNLSVEGEHVGQAIYKPLRGERPLWDFEPGLYRREIAAYLLSEAMGLGIVPPTVVRNGPLGDGSLQWFIDADHQQHYFTLYENRPDLHEAMQAFAVFDFVANNTDRKSGHVLLDGDDQLWGIDHGVCFHEEFKLRTVIWEFAGERVPDEILADLTRLRHRIDTGDLDGLDALLAPVELDALTDRLDRLVHTARFPMTTGDYHDYPWPMI